MKCSSWNTYVIIWTESSLQWNGCCLATNAKEEPAYFSLFLSPPLPVEGVLKTHQHTGGFVFSPGDGKSNEGGHEGTLLSMHMELVGQPVTDSNFVHGN